MRRLRVRPSVASSGHPGAPPLTARDSMSSTIMPRPLRRSSCAWQEMIFWHAPCARASGLFAGSASRSSARAFCLSVGPALPFMAAQGTAAHPARAPPPDRAKGELNRWVFQASHSRIPEIVELSQKTGDAAPTSHAPSNRAAPTPGSRRSTTGSRSPSAWPTASTASPTSSP